MSTTQDRRPGLRALAESIQRRNPTWSFQACASIAKLQWTMNAHHKISTAQQAKGGAP